MEIILWSIAGGLLLQLLFVLWNLSQLPRLGMQSDAGRQWLAASANSIVSASSKPKLSILIPARNEANNIASCLLSALRDPSPFIEVLVLDDQSTDDTAAAALAAAKGDARFTLLSGNAVPSAWMGKSYACHQLSQAARGEWWLFLDADARLEPDALAAAMSTALAQEEGLVTGFPYQETGTWLERLIVPLMTFMIACHLPIRLVRLSSDPRFVAAHGAFMLIHAKTYEAIGGHSAFKSHLVDDMQLARAVKKGGYQVTLADITDHVKMRMYKDAAGVWNGYKKNIFAGLGRNVILLFCLLCFYSLFYLLPPAAALIGLVAYGAGAMNGLTAAASMLLPALIGWLLAIAIKLNIDQRNGQPIWLSLLLPVSIIALIGIAIGSWRDAGAGRGYIWKGRRYS